MDGFRDGACVPLEGESHWIQQNYGRWISDMDGSMEVSQINSVQNRLLVRAGIHKLFDQYLISVNPDVGPALQIKSILLEN